MKTHKLAWMSMVLIVILMISAVSCGSQTPTVEPVGEQPTAPPAAAPTAAPTDAPVAEPDKDAPITEGPESNLRAPYSQIDNLDPSGLPSTNDTDIQKKMFTGLLDYRVDGTEVFVGAESYEVNDTADVYTFKLRKEAKWSDGQPITANDYVWAWQHVQDPATASGYASFAYIVKNAEKINTGEITDLSQLGVKALDDYTLEVTLEQPATFFPRLVAFATMYPLRKDVIEKYGDKWLEPENIVTNGPWLMKVWEKDVQIVFERNPNWWLEAPKIETLTILLMDDPLATSTAMFEADEVDFARFSAEDYVRIKDDPELAQYIQLITQSGMSFVVFDTTNPPFDDVRVRQAFNLAIDRVGIVEGILQGLGKPAYILAPPGIAGRNEDAYIGTRDYAKDVEMAQKLLADAGYPNGEGFPEVELKYRTLFLEQKQGESLPAIWEKALGVKVVGAPTESQAYREWFQSRADQPFDMMIYGWGSDYEDPYNYFNTIWPSWSDLYHTHWVNEEYDQLAKDAGLETDPQMRVEKYMKVDEVLERELPMAPTFYWVNSYLLKPWVKGDVFDSMSGFPLYYAWIVAH
jgi:oligopeptide transport system substrate-binding protein